MNEREIVAEIDRAIDLLVALKSGMDGQPKALSPSTPVEAAARVGGLQCTVCGKDLKIIDGNPDRIRGACRACHKKVNRLIVAGKVTDDETIERGWYLPAAKGGRTFKPDSPGAILRREAQLKKDGEVAD